MAIGDRIGLPDDVSVGYIIGINEIYVLNFSIHVTILLINNVIICAENLLKIKLTRVEQFHSHLEPMRLIKKDLFSEQVIKT